MRYFPAALTSIIVALAMAQQNGQGFNAHASSPFKSTEARVVSHTKLNLPVSFDQFTTAFEAKLPRYDLASIRNITPLTHANIVANFTSVLNGQPFAIFSRQSFGLLATLNPSNLTTNGQLRATVKGIKYVLGNVILAMAMTSQVMPAQLYVPPAIAVSENDNVGWCVVEWDCLAEQLGEETCAVGTVREIAALVDQQREAVVWSVYQEALKE